jgi:prepilin-type N-terminal cleavage/methylation domain-containing protein
MKRNKGFTLVELIIVIAILAILSVAAVLGFRAIQTSAQDNVEKTNAGVIVRALNNFNNYATTPITTATGLADRVTASPGGLWVRTGTVSSPSNANGWPGSIDMNFTLSADDFGDAGALARALVWLDYSGNRWIVRDERP